MTLVVAPKSGTSESGSSAGIASPPTSGVAADIGNSSAAAAASGGAL